MILIPAIDLKGGHCVRLRQGVMEDATVFSENPLQMAQHWYNQGAERLHLVDLDGAFEGRPENESIINKIAEGIGKNIPVQVGGGIRDIPTVERYLDRGVTFVVIGTAAVKNPAFLIEACRAFPNQIIVGLDAKDGKVAVDGWANVTEHSVIDLAKKFQSYGVEEFIYTDIGRDGMMNGANVEATQALAAALEIPVIASGGISSLEDIRKLRELEAEGVKGAITGRAIYEEAFDFEIANRVAKYG
ncbi:1-(5-phosphoribosyl)-5-[(5-phosphoribosylamino)methylideneamino]imidazole-4-carboxamide isomerase [Burkholderiales bacterium]|jgi:phosphoribosylformimino-5-aminoimidazole carboxamide ribotide isomerase|nr:1-(5-phosphoribosyl)-5-[(5-phosphoribosylamino)methylideneamino]imidazole-4-carboxamide isomerase [Burkholderiales bacterium]